MVTCWTDVETVSSVQGPGCSCRRPIKNEGFCPERCQGRFIEVKSTVYFLIGRDGRITSGKSQEVEGEFNLWKEFIPQLQGAKAVNSGEGGNKMLLKCRDRSFGRNDAMIVRGFELDVHFVGADVMLDRLGTFIGW